MRTKLRMTRILLGVLVAATTMVVSPHVAAAATDASASPAEVAEASPTGTLTVTARSAGKAGRPAVEIVCRTTVVSPPSVLKLGTLPPAVDTVGETTCTAPVSSIQHVTVLNYVFQGIPLQADAEPGPPGTTSSRATAAFGGCRDGIWEGISRAVIVFPAGFQPPSGSIRQLRSASVTC